MESLRKYMSNLFATRKSVRNSDSGVPYPDAEEAIKAIRSRLEARIAAHALKRRQDQAPLSR